MRRPRLLRVLDVLRRRRRRAAAAGPAAGAPVAVLPGASLALPPAGRVVDRLVDELSRAGGVDEGNGAALDHLVDTWRAQQRELLHVYHLDRQDASQRAMVLTQQRLEAARFDQARARAELDEADRLAESATRNLVAPAVPGRAPSVVPVQRVSESA